MDEKKTGRKPRIKREKKTNMFRPDQDGQNCRLVQWMKDNPEKVAEIRKRTKYGRKQGQPDGFLAKDAAKLREKVKREAKIIVEKIAKDHNIDDQYAKEALETVVEVMRMPGDTRSKLAAAKTLLEFTKQKPVAKSEVAVAKAEDFLAAVLAAEQGKTEE